MKKRLRKKLMLGEFQNWMFELSLRHDARVAEDDLELWDHLFDAVAAGQMFCGGGGSGGSIDLVVGFNDWPDAHEREAKRQVLASDLRRLQEPLGFKFEIGPLQVDLSKAGKRAPRAANRQRQANARRGIQEMLWG